MSNQFAVTAMKSILDQRLSVILKESVTAELKPLGFTKQGNDYVRPQGDLLWIVNVQRSQWNMAAKIQFTINCGVYVPGFTRIFYNKPEGVRPHEIDCCIRTRVGLLREKHNDWWGELCADTSDSTLDNQMTIEIRDQLTRYAVPFLQRFECRRDVITYLTTPRTAAEFHVWPQSESNILLYLGLLEFLTGNVDACSAVLAEAETKTKYNEHITDLRKRLCGV